MRESTNNSNHSNDIQTILESLEFNIIYFREQLKALKHVHLAAIDLDNRNISRKQIDETEKQIDRLKHAMIFIEDMSRRKLI